MRLPFPVEIVGGPRDGAVMALLEEVDYVDFPVVRPEVFHFYNQEEDFLSDRPYFVWRVPVVKQHRGKPAKAYWYMGEEVDS